MGLKCTSKNIFWIYWLIFEKVAIVCRYFRQAGCRSFYAFMLRTIPPSDEWLRRANRAVFFSFILKSIILIAITHNKKPLQFSKKFPRRCELKFMFSKKATKIDEIFTVNLTVTTYVLSNWRWRFNKFLWPLRKREL